MKQVYAVAWDEHDSWSGPSYDAAHSIHLSPIDAGKFFTRMRDEERVTHQGRTPANYYSPQAPGHWADVSEKVYDKVAASKDGIWAAKVVNEEYIA